MVVGPYRKMAARDLYILTINFIQNAKGKN